MKFKTHVIIGLLICSTLSFLGSKGSIIQASLNMPTTQNVSLEEFEELNKETVFINIDNQSRQTLLSNLRLVYTDGIIKVSDDTYSAIQSLFSFIQNAENAKLINKNSSLYLKPSKLGKQINLNLLEKELNQKKFHDSKVINLESYSTYPSYNTSQARNDMNLVKQNQNQQIKFIVNSEIGYFSSKVYSIFDFATYFKGNLEINQEELSNLLSILSETVNIPAQNITLDIKDQEYVVNSVGKLGQKLNITQSLDTIKKAIRNKQATAELEYEILNPKVYTNQGQETQWNLISFGASDYSGSIANRVTNIKMASDWVYNNTVLNPGDSFSYNKQLIAKGSWIDWKNAFVIVNGKDLKEAPGGGLCQVSTTIYRAAIQAGLPISKLRNHSLYVKYYTKHGDGLDATIYPGAQDLVFENNLDSPILIQLYHTPNNKLITTFYSEAKPDPVKLIGPFYANNHSEFPDLNVQRNEIKWIREFINTGENEVFTSAYNEPVI